MKHQNIYQAILPVAALAFVFSACTFEQEDFFEESASLRIQHTNEKVKNILCQGSEQNGWLIQYFVAGTEDYNFEGFNLFGRFYDNGKVTLSSNHRYLRNGKAGSYTEYTSFYEMLAEEGPVLSFNTWNDVLTVFVDPVSPSSAPGVLVSDGEGMHGDDRLVLSSYNENELNFRGERYTAPVRFVRLDRSPEEYLVLTTVAKMVFAGGKIDEYSLSNGSVTKYISGLSNGYFDYVERLDDPLDRSVLSCVFTSNGFRTKDPFVVGNDTVQEFVLDLDNDCLVCGNVVMKACWQRSLGRWLAQNGTVTITNEGNSDSFNALYNAVSDAITSAFSAQEFTSMCFGTSNETARNRRTGLVFTMKTSNKTYQVGFTGSARMDGDKMVLSFDPSDYSSNYSTYEKNGIGTQFLDFVTAMNGTYTLSSNSYFAPSKIVATKDGDPNFSFTMHM